MHTRAPHGKFSYIFIDMLQFPHDCNITIYVLLQVLLDLKENLPPVLNIQLDNTAKENKNKFFLGFCALLVARKIFTKVSSQIIYYIDACVSQRSTFIRANINFCWIIFLNDLKCTTVFYRSGSIFSLLDTLMKTLINFSPGYQDS